MPGNISELDKVYTLHDEATAIRKWTRQGIPPPSPIATIVDNQFFFRPREEIEAHNAVVLERKTDLSTAPEVQIQRPQKRGLVANVRLAGASLLAGLRQT